MKKAFRALILFLTIATSVVGLPVRVIEAAAPAVPSGYEMVDLITNSSFDDSAASIGFEPNDSVALDGNPVRTDANPISGTGSLKLDPLKGYGRIIYYTDYPYEGGPFADSVTFAAKVRVDAASSSGKKLQVCSIVYLQTTTVPLSTCQEYPVASQSIVDVFLTVDTDGQQLDQVYPQFKLDDSGTITATVDDAHFYVVQPQAAAPIPTPTPPPSSCSADTWSCSGWNACSVSGAQTRTCSMTSDCAGVVTPSPATSQSCTPPTTPTPTCTADTWSCTDWNACSASGIQSRTCSMTSDCASATTPSPAVSQSCTPPSDPPPTCTADTWSCTDWNACSTSGNQTRSCSMTSDCAGVTTPSPATTASCSQVPSGLLPGTLIKHPSYSAVYYLAANGKRYVFPNEATFKTWYRIPEAFATVQVLTPAQIGAILIGESNVTYRGGFRLLKTSTDPKVYAPVHGGVLRPIASEQVAAAVFGTNWAALVDDIPDAFFTNYTIGAPITSASQYNRSAELAAAISINGDKGLGDIPTSTPLPTPPDGNTTPPPPSCTADTWTCSNWNACTSSGNQTRTCTMTSDCAGVTTPSPATSQSCTPPTTGGGTTAYHAALLNLPATHPYISLQDFAPSVGSAEYTRFKTWVDAALAGNPGWGFSQADAAIMYGLTNEEKYITYAITQVDKQVTAAEAAIAGGNAPAIANDSYLDAGPMLEDLAFTYDRGFSKLTASQKTRWAAYADQALYNIWNPENAKWGSTSHHWTGWSIDNPGNNYHYSFLLGTMSWALASQNQTWLTFLQTSKFSHLVDYYVQIPGGGTREGTGYGTALKGLFWDYILWKSSAKEDLSTYSSHVKNTIEYWVNATVPTRDKFAPIGDLSRSSQPDLYDYHENLVKEAVMLSPGTEQARHGVWWLNNNSVTPSGFNLRATLLKPVDSALAPSALSYNAQGTGAFFTRSSWDANALWAAFQAGPYDESHAHLDPGSFSLFKDDWLAVTSNIWSHSGLQGNPKNGNEYLGTEAHNVLRFTKNGSVLWPNYSVSTMTSMTDANGTLTVNANLTPAYSSNASSVQSWTRQFIFNPTAKSLRVTDACQIGSGVSATFQVHVPVQPVTQSDGSIKAGKLVIRPAAGLTARFVSMSSVKSDFGSGWRVDLTNPNGCAFTVDMTAL